MSRRPASHRLHRLTAAPILGVALLLSGSAVESAIAQPADDVRPSERPERGDRPDRLREGQRGEGGMMDRLRERRERFAEERGLDDAQIAEHYERVLAVLDDIDPDLAQRVRDGEQVRPGIKMAMLQRRFPEVLHLARLRQHDKEMYGLRVRELVLYQQMRGLARQIRVAERQEAQGEDPAFDADDLRKNLEDLAEDHFEARQSADELEIERIEESLEKRKERFDENDRNERELIQRTIDDLLSGDGHGQQRRGGPGIGPGHGPGGGMGPGGPRSKDSGRSGPPQP